MTDRSVNSDKAYSHITPAEGLAVRIIGGLPEHMQVALTSKATADAARLVTARVDDNQE